MDNVITQRLILIIAGVAILTFSARRKWITPSETGWVGAAMIFAANAWVLQAVLNVTITDFSNRFVAVAVGVLLTLPLDAALIIGLVVLTRNLKRQAETHKDN